MESELFVKDYKSDYVCAVAFHICGYPQEFQELMNVKQIPLVLLDLSVEKISDKELFDYFFPSRVYLLDAYFRVNPDLKLFQKLKSLFEEWKVENEFKIEKLKIKKELIEIESKLNEYFEDFWIERISKNPKIYKSSPQEVRNNKRILLLFPSNFRFSSKELRNNDEIIQQLSTHKHFHLVFKYLPRKYKMTKEYALLAVFGSSDCFKHIDHSLIDKEFIMKMCEKHPVKISSMVASFFPHKLYEDLDLVSFLLKYQGFPFYNLPHTLKVNENICRIAINAYPISFLNFDDEMKSKMEFLKIFIHIFPSLFTIYVPKSISMDESYVDELFKFNPLLFLYFDDKFKTKDNFLYFVENFTNYSEININKIPIQFTKDAELMITCLKLNPKNLMFFSRNNESYIHGIVNHLHVYLLEYLASSQFQEKHPTFLDWYWRNFPSIQKYLNSNILLENNSLLSHDEFDSHFNKNRSVWKMIDLELKRIYFPLSEEKIKKFSDLNFNFFQNLES
jgi:hypothetical protein